MKRKDKEKATSLRQWHRPHEESSRGNAKRNRERRSTWAWPYSALLLLLAFTNFLVGPVRAVVNPPHDLTVKVVSGKVVNVDWDPPLDGRFDGFKLTIEPLSAQDDSGIRTVIIGIQDPTPVPIRDLTPGASYEVRLHSVYRREDSKVFLKANFTTFPSVPAVPTIWYRNETTLLVKIQSPPAESIVDHYKVTIFPDDADESTQIIERPEMGKAQVAFHDLIPGKPYNITVQSISLDKISEPSSAVFRTVPFAPSESDYSSGANVPSKLDFGRPLSSSSSSSSMFPTHIAPIFTNGGPPSDLTSQDGRDAEIQCEASGSPYPSVEWFFAPLSARESNRKLDLNSSPKYGANAHGALSITQLEKADEGFYSCIRANTMGKINGTTKLSVIIRTSIDQPPVDSKVILSSTAELQCRVRHDPTVQVKIYWTFNKRNLTSSSRIKVASDGTLRIEQVRNTDVGLYTCRVESIGGSEKRSARLDVIELPHPPTNVMAELNVNGGLVNVSWTPPFDGNSPIIKYVVQMRTMSSTAQSAKLTDNSPTSGSSGSPSTDDELVYGVNTWTTASMNISASQNFVLITNLRPAMTYQFRVSALNSVGEGQPSAPTNPPITLPAQPPNASPIGVVGAPRSSTAITIQWQQPPTESHNGQLIGYMVRYKLAGYAEHTPWYTFNVTNPAQMSCLLEDLIVWQNYQIQVAAYNEMGVGAYSSSIYVRTKEGKPASAVRNLEAEAVSSTAIRVTWLAPDPQLINGINQGYKVQAWFSKNVTQGKGDDSDSNSLYRSANIEHPAREIIVPPSPFQDGQQSATIDGLEPFTIYDITALCFTSAGDGPKADPPQVVTTKQDLPLEVSFFKFRDILDKSVRVIWGKPKQVNGKLLAYTLRYNTVGADAARPFVLNLTASDNQTIINNLTPQTAYTFEINAWTDVGAGPIVSSTIQSSVPPVLPVAPTHLAISNIGPFSVVLQFTPGFNGNASITKWIVEGQPSKIRNSNWNVVYESLNHTQDDAITVHSLRPYSEYRLRLIPVNVVGRSLTPSESSPPFQTLQALPAGPPSNVTVRTVSATALRVRWTPLPPESWHGHPRGYNITWRELDDAGIPLSDSPLRSYILADYHSHSYLITSLNEFTNYRIQVFALNDLGTSAGSHSIMQRTNEATPSLGPKSVKVHSTSSTTVVVEWGDIPAADWNGIIQGYKVRYSALKAGAGLVESAQFKIIENNASHTATLTELKKYTKYQINVCGFTHVGDGVYSQAVTELTHQDVPGPPSNVTFPDVTLTTARIRWDIPEEPNGDILAYKVSYRLSDEHDRRGIIREFLSSDRTYRFLDLRPETYYVFEVTAKTGEGWGKAAKVTVYTTNTRELPSPPSQPLISVSQISSRQVTISWTPGRDGFAPLRYYTVQISSQGGHWWTYHSKIDPTLRAYTVTDLKPFTTYQFRLKATNDIGDSGWSSESPITRTLPAPPDTVPQNVIVSPYTPTSVLVKWHLIEDWNGDDMGAGYRIQYCIITQQGVSTSCPSSIVRGRNRTSVTIENLERDQHYEIRVVPFNGQGDGPATKAKVVYVGEAVPTGEPLDISTEPLSSTEIKVAWRPPDHNKQNGQIMGYKIFYWVHSPMQAEGKRKVASTTTQSRELMEIVPDTLESFILLDLLKWTNYSIQISAFNPAGDGPRSKAVIVQTREDTPGEVGKLQFDEITMSQVKVSWAQPNEPNGVLLGYYINYETLIGDFSKQVKQKINDSYLVVNGLRERVTYTFKVRAENSMGLGPEKVGNVTTGPQSRSPAAPFEVISMQTLTSVKLKWKNPDYRDPLLGYIIEANNLNKKSALEWQPIASLRNGRQDRYELSFTQLSPSSQYTFRIMAVNQAGVSEPAYPNKIYGGSAIISTPSHLELRARMPYYRESWFVILCACLSVIITIMVIAFLCVRNKTYKYKKEAIKNSNGSQDRLSELGFGLDDNIDPGSNAFSPIEFEMRSTGSMGTSLSGQRNDRTRATLQRNRNNANNGSVINTAAIAAQAKAPPRPCPGSFSYSDEDDDQDDDIKAGGFYESSGNDSLTEKPSELSSTGPDSESDDHDDLVAANNFVNHYANVNDTLRKGGISWKKQAKPYIVPTSSQQSLNTSNSNSTYRPLPHPPSHRPSTSAGPGVSGSHFSLSAAPGPSYMAAGPSGHQQQQQQATLQKSILTSASTSSINFPSRPSRQAPAPPPPSYRSAMNVNASEESEIDSPSVSNPLNGGRIIVNNMAGSRAPLPGFSSFV